MKIRKAIIPAAGLGTRVLPASKAVPKEMLNIVDKPAIQYIVEEAVAAGIEDILIITNRGKGVIEDHFDHAFELETQLKANPSKAGILEQVMQASQVGANIYFLRQKITKGLGHAVLCGKSFVGDEPFAVLYGDDVILNPDPVTAQLVRVSEANGGCGVVGVNEVSLKNLPKYCSVGATPVPGQERVFTVPYIIEKPSPAQIETEKLSRYSILGRVILPPEIFGLLEQGCAETPAGEEYYLTDAMAELGRQGKLMAVDFIGRRYDMGNKFGILQANCEVALHHPEVAEEFKAYVKTLAAAL
ncbi:MAG: UTP--glucose-1-phosphate uridylyltransferase [Oscillospiraceae bacterium]|jgi:UTP--glucose-1-phosphate uridylyltransferase|nr:UTP--glucose-1-phosphate uridylyltransferase [Oscillospiraceae bacterium]